MSTLKGYKMIARGKRESASAQPRVIAPKNKPLIAKPRESANLVCGQFGCQSVSSSIPGNNISF